METATLPHGWKRLPLADAYDFTSKPRELRYDAYAAVPFVPMERIPFAHPRSSSFDLRPPDQLTAGTYFEEGDLLLPKITPSFENGKQAIVVGLPDGFGIATTEVFPIRGRTGESSTEFLFFSLLRSGVRVALADKMIGTTGRQRIPKLAITDLIISLPPLPEQKAIARALRSVQQAREARRRELELERERKVALMEYLFTHGTRNEPTKQTEIGEMPESWEMLKIGQILKLKSGATRPADMTASSDADHPVPVYGGNGIMGFAPQPFNQDTLIVIGRVGEYCGCVHVAQPPCWITDNALYSEKWLRSDVLPAYVAQALIHMNLNQFRRKAGQPLVTQGVLHDLLLPIPVMSEQAAVAGALSTCENRAAALERELSLLDELFAAMLDELMTGRLSAVPLVEQTQ